MNILVLEDEQRAGEKLIDFIKIFQPDATIHWERSISDGIQFLEKHTDLDLIFSDIELLDGNVFQLYARITPDCPIIFCTAYDAYYVDAFQTNGIAYLLKPYTALQFKAAWEKYHLLFETTTTNDALQATLSQIQAAVGQQSKAYKTTFSVKKSTGVFFLKVEDVAYFQSKGDFVVAIDGKNTKHILSHSLAEIEERINPAQFFRINRSEIIHKKSLLKYNSYIKNRLAITLSAPAVTLYTTNSRTPEFRAWAER